MSSYELDSIAVAANFAHYAQDRGLPAELFQHPDYIALQAVDIADFETKIRETGPRAEQITIAEVQDRFIASIRLAGSLSVADLGRVRWLEIAEPTDIERWVGLGSDRVGFYYSDIEKARSMLGAKWITYKIDDEPAPTIRVGYTEVGVNGEFTLSKMPFEALVEEDIQADRVTFVKRAA